MDNSKWNNPVSSTPISQYADSYFITMKINPFKVGQGHAPEPKKQKNEEEAK